MLSDLIHKRTFQMYDASAGNTFQMEMLLAVVPHFHILVHRLTPLLCHVFHDRALFCKLVQIPVNGCDVHLVIIFFQILVDVCHRHRAVTVRHKIFQDFFPARCCIAIPCHYFISFLSKQMPFSVFLKYYSQQFNDNTPEHTKTIECRHDSHILFPVAIQSEQNQQTDTCIYQKTGHHCPGSDDPA